MEKCSRPKAFDVGSSPTDSAKYCEACKKPLKKIKGLVTESVTGKTWCSINCCLSIKCAT